MAPQGFLAVDLRHVLAAIGQDAIDSEWVIYDVEATGNACQALESLTKDKRIAGVELSSLANDVVQVIEGMFLAFHVGQKSPWVTIHADDSTFYDVETDDEQTRDRILATFKRTELR